MQENFFGMFGDGDIEKMIENHPLNVFARLVRENPGNSVYEKCLNDEICAAADEFMQNVDDEQMKVYEFLQGMAVMSCENLDENDEEYADLAMKVKILTRIFDEIHRRKGQSDGNKEQ